jgi:hypothetical protein
MATKHEFRNEALDQIQQNIASSGMHIYVVSGGAVPRFSYTIGLSETLGYELVLAGAIRYFLTDVSQIFSLLVKSLPTSTPTEQSFRLGDFGSFTLSKVHQSWSEEMLLGAFDYYKRKSIPALQLVPDQEHWTVDIPNLNEPWGPESQPVWKWLKHPWLFDVSEDSLVVTNLKALEGTKVTEVARWEESEWEAFAGSGPDTEEADFRVVPLGTMIASDPSLEFMLGLEVGKGCWRDGNGDWNLWS